MASSPIDLARWRISSGLRRAHHAAPVDPAPGIETKGKCVSASRRGAPAPCLNRILHGTRFVVPLPLLAIACAGDPCSSVVAGARTSDKRGRRSSGDRRCALRPPQAGEGRKQQDHCRAMSLGIANGEGKEREDLDPPSRSCCPLPLLEVEREEGQRGGGREADGENEEGEREGKG